MGDKMDHFKLLEQFSKATDLPISIFEQGNLIFKGHTDRQDYSIPMYLMECLPQHLPGIWISRTPEHIFFGGLSIRQHNQQLLIGPVFASECSLVHCEQILRRLGRRVTEPRVFQKIINAFASCDVPHLKDNLRFLNHVLNGEENTEVESIDFKWKNIFPTPKELPIEVPLEPVPDVEENILAFIRNGKVKELENYFNEELFRTNHPMQALTHDVNLRRNYIIGANTLISRIAIQEGVDVRMAGSLSEYYLEQLMNTNNLTDLGLIFYKLAVDYAGKIESLLVFASEDLLSRKVNGFVQAHLYEKLSTSVIAETLHMNEAYLCDEFKKATGLTISGFIQDCKVREAKFLLEKGYTPREVGDMLEFSSSSYFGAVFKKVTGMTPMEYRRSVE